MKKIILLLGLVSVVALGVYYLTLSPAKVEEKVYSDSLVEVGFVEITNAQNLSFTRNDFNNINEKDPSRIMKGVRFFTEDFKDQGMQSAGSCSEERINNGGYELYVRTTIDNNVDESITLDDINWESKIELAEMSGPDEVKMIELQGYDFIYEQGTVPACGNYVYVEGYSSPSHRVRVSMNYYNESALEDFEDIINSLEFLKI